MKKISTLYILVFILASCVSHKKVTLPIKDTYIIDKYAQVLAVSKTEITNIKLYEFIHTWYGTKYKYGGLSKNGIDCSGFCNVLYKEIYNKQLERRTVDIAKTIKKINQNKLQEGDLVFFSIATKKNSHVGVYLKNTQFVHASTSRGVIISSLNNPCYKKTYNKGGRLQ